MTITTTLTTGTIHEGVGRTLFYGRGCFGVHNCLNNSYLLTIANGTDVDYIRPHRTVASVADDLEVLEFWPHVDSNKYTSGKVEQAVELFNTFGPYKDMFVCSPANSIQVHLKDHPCDKVFTGLMTIRDYLYGNIGGSWNFLLNGVEEGAEDFYLRSRIAIVLSLCNASFNPFSNRVSVSSSNNGRSESDAIMIESDTDALALFFLIYGTEEECADCWSQDKMGIGQNRNGYVRNYGDSITRIGRERGYNEGDYVAMSHWLDAWVSNGGHKDPSFDRNRGRLTVGQFLQRVRERLAPGSLEPNQNKADIIIELFEELKDMYK